MLAVSRAFGDRLLKQYVVAEPELQVRQAIFLLWERRVCRAVPYLPKSCSSYIEGSSVLMPYFGIQWSQFRVFLAL